MSCRRLRRGLVALRHDIRRHGGLTVLAWTDGFDPWMSSTYESLLPLTFDYSVPPPSKKDCLYENSHCNGDAVLHSPVPSQASSFQRKTVYKNGTIELTIIDDEPTSSSSSLPYSSHDDADQPDEIVKNLSGVAQVVQRVAFGDHQEACDLPPPPPHPTDVVSVRKLMRSKMIRCKRCKNRFIERNIYERHLRDKHPEDYTVYIEEQEAEMEQQRQEEIEANRIEELQTGGFIPPESEIEASTFEVDVEGIPLPGENNGGVAPRFDQYGRLKQLKRPYKKKTFVCFECTPIRNLCSDVRLLNHRKKFHRGDDARTDSYWHY
ncbi:hypothetical protein TELCIR_00568 [Teladorsagia circumcincta]|uniref:C2H2-type domain-containing protein n=1 Tax=Teladorsagia circumcincta TaxID=45464 RepID=A0A2G9V4A0_TELCI|nr:hypothetical protein TELCIR_00568 [Teladorsagia circumcincta]